MSGRNSQVTRILTSLSLLESRPAGMTIDEIHKALNDRGHAVDKRTVYRDVQALQEIGIPICEGEETLESGLKGLAKRFSIDRNAKINRYLVLTSRELIALFMARGMLKPLEATPFYQDLSGVFKKIENVLGAKAEEYIRELEGEIVFGPGPKWGLGLQPDVIDTVRAACSEGHCLNVEYASANSKTTRMRKLGPHFLYFRTGSLYLVAEDLEEMTVKTFAVPRIKNAEMTEETYDGKAVDPDEYFKDSFGIFKGGAPERVEIEFSSTVGPYVRERGWHNSQSFVIKSDGIVLMKFDVAITPELVQWVLGFGAHATVRKPEALAKSVLEAAEAVVKHYAKLARVA